MRWRSDENALLASILVLAARAGEVTHTGFLTDILCWELEDAVDGANMRTAPEAHTVHCMRDLQKCIDSGFGVLERPEGETDYQLKYRLDERGNQNALALLQQTSKRANFIVTVRGDEHGDVLRNAEVVEPASGAVPDGVAGDFRRPPEPVLCAHMSLMLLSWGCMLPWGVVLANRTRKIGAPGAWFTSHLRLQTYGWGLQLAGFVCGVVYTEAYTAHFIRVHPVLGIITVVIGTLQPVNAVLRAHPEPKTRIRRAWEVVHKGGGRLCIATGVASIATGIQLIDALAYDVALIASASAVACLGLLSAAAYFALSKWSERLEPRAARNERRPLDLALRSAALACFRLVGAKGTVDESVIVQPLDDTEMMRVQRGLAT